MIAALSALDNNDDYRIFALTRNSTSPGAAKLQQRFPNISLVSGDFNEPTAIFAACEAQINAVFAVQMPSGFPPSVTLEEKQGVDLIDAACAHGVGVYVQSTVDRGPEAEDEGSRTTPPHFGAKANIERHLISRCDPSSSSTKGMTYTILRPSSFMDNLSVRAGFLATLAASAFKYGLSPDRRIQMIAIRDIGWFAAQALTNPTSDVYRNQCLSLAGDEIDYRELDATCQQVTGKPLPTTYALVNWIIGKLVPELPMTITFIRQTGFDADIRKLKRLHPDMWTWKRWLEMQAVSEGTAK